MAVEYDPNGIPILSGESMLSDVPTYTTEVASFLGLDQIVPKFAGPYHHNFGNLAAGAGTTSLTAFRFNGEVGDVWTGSFNFGIGSVGGTGGLGTCKVKLQLASGIQLNSGANGGLTFDMATGGMTVSHATFTWRATQANDHLIFQVVDNAYGTTDTQLKASAINHGNLSATTRMKRERTKDAK